MPRRPVEPDETFSELTGGASFASVEAPSSDLPGVQRASLVVLLGEARGSTFIVGGEVLIGRHPDAHVRFDSTAVSRRHAIIRRNDRGQFVIRDLKSRNGTRVNGQAITERALNYGDRVHLGNTIVLLFTHYDDLTEQLAQAQRMESIGRLAGGIAHDFNNLLGVVLANLAFVDGLPKESALSEALVRDALGDMRSAAMRAVELTRQLLVFARRGEWRTTTFELNSVVDEVVRFVRRTFDRSVDISVKVQNRMFVTGDPSQVHQVLMNLCINARDAMPKGGAISITAEEALPARLPASLRTVDGQRFVAIAVRDSGDGIDPITKERIFEPFFTTKEVGSGTGLGLSTVYGIVQRHGGDIIVESTRGRGSTFTVFLPIPSQEEAARGEERKTDFGKATMEMDFNRGLVLVIDDEETVRRGAIRLLEQSGFQVLGAKDGEEAISVFQRHHNRLSLVLLDLMMPGASGDRVFEILRAIDRRVPIVMCSGGADEERAQALVQGGAQGFLAKPYDGMDLERAIERAITTQTPVR